MNEIQRLISDYFDGGLSEEEGRRLREYIAENPEHAREFMRASLLHTCLYEYITGADLREESGAPGDANISPASLDVVTRAPARPALYRFPARGRQVAAAAIGVCFGAILLYLALNSGRFAPNRGRVGAGNDGFVHGGAGSSEGVATLGRGIGAEWGVPGVTAGEAMGAGVYALRAGYAEVKFVSGAAVVVRGPAAFAIDSAMHMKLTAGSLTTEVPAGARGFTVDVPGASVVDLGTEVGVSVDGEQESHVEVFKGRARVELASANGAGGARVLEPAMAVNVNAATATLEESSPEPLAFVRRGELDLVGPGVSGAVRWRGMVEELRKDPDLVAWYSFANLYGPAEKLKNLAGATSGEFDGVLENVTWEEGRFPDRPAMRFHGAGSRGLVNIPVPLTSLTVAAWVKLESFDHKYVSLLMSDGTHERSDLCHLQLSKLEGKPALHLSTPTPSAWDMYPFRDATLSSALKKWRFVAVVFDRTKGMGQWTVSGYVDGVCVGTRPVAGNPPPLVFGAAEIGNWKGSRAGDARPLDGWIDDVALWKRPLKAEEIERMYEAGSSAEGK